ncbi:hypothetical protein HPF90_0357, partial [Helicobacter pylori]
SLTSSFSSSLTSSFSS